MYICTFIHNSLLKNRDTKIIYKVLILGYWKYIFPMSPSDAQLVSHNFLKEQEVIQPNPFIAPQ